MATKEQPKWEGKISAKINGPTADQVWPLLADFGNLYKIFPSDVSFSVEGVSGQPGELRYSASKVPSPSDSSTTVVLWAKEKLVAIDATQRFVTYEILENNRGVKTFFGTMKVLPIDDHGCQFEWSFVFDPVDEYTYKDGISTLNLLLQGMVEKIENIFQPK